MSDEGALYLTEAEVASLIDMGEAVGGVQDVLEHEAAGGAHNMLKTHVAFGDGSILHALGSAVPADGLAATKTWTYTKRGGHPILALFDGGSGRVLALMEANVLGQLRTGAISGVATHWMASPNARSLAIIGSGRQALTQAAAVAAVRDLTDVRVWSPNPERRAAFCATLAERLSLRAVAAPTLDAAIDGVDIVTLITRAQTPFFHGSSLAPGTHVNAAGAIVPSYVEFFPDLLDRASLVAADTVATVRTMSREFMDYYGTDDAKWSAVLPLSTIAAGCRNRHDPSALSVFKSVGMGLSDMAVAMRAYHRALERGVGRRLPASVSAAPDYRAAVPPFAPRASGVSS